jgi:hypothetical protein
MASNDDVSDGPRVCVDCRASAPRTETNYTLISSKHGWRLAKRIDAVTGLVFEWRCPSCWERYKATRGAPASTPRPDDGPASARRAAPPPPPSKPRPPR